MIRSICGFRLKGISHGPLYAYRNVFLDNQENFRNFGWPEVASPATVYVYHNTVTSPAAARAPSR